MHLFGPENTDAAKRFSEGSANTSLLQ